MPPWQGVEGHLVVSVNGNDKEWIFIPHDIPDSQETINVLSQRPAELISMPPSESMLPPC